MRTGYGRSILIEPLQKQLDSVVRRDHIVFDGPDEHCLYMPSQMIVDRGGSQSDRILHSNLSATFFICQPRIADKEMFVSGMGINNFGFKNHHHAGKL
ncbi:hypothetical protein OAG75_01025 [bacterium]|nr:hypothetical protein [bacterium]